MREREHDRWTVVTTSTVEMGLARLDLLDGHARAIRRASKLTKS
jgi:hypothetical protein